MLHGDASMFSSTVNAGSRLAVEKICKGLPRIEQQLVNFGTGRIRPMSVGIVMEEIIADGCGDRSRDLSCAGAVEIHDLMAVVLAI